MGQKVIADDTIVEHIFKKNSPKQEDIDLIIDYFNYCHIIIETIPDILEKYIDPEGNTPGALFAENIITSWGHIHFKEIEPWTEEACILTLCNTSCSLYEKVWLLTDKNYSNIKTPDETVISPHSRVVVWNIKSLVSKIKADTKFMAYIQKLKDME